MDMILSLTIMYLKKLSLFLNVILIELYMGSRSLIKRSLEGERRFKGNRWGKEEG